MNKTFKTIFGPIQADEALKNRTKAFLAQKAQSCAQTDRKKHWYRAYAAACACMLMVLFGGCRLYFTPTAKISIDINPSIELDINRFDRVIAVNGLNEDGQSLSSTLDIRYKDYMAAIEEIINHDSIKLLLSGDELMTITVIGLDGQQSAKILSGVQRCAAGQRNTRCYFAKPEEVAEACETGLSCGKYRAFLELHYLDPAITPEMVQGMTMREIQDLTDSLTAGHENKTSSYNGWENGRHGDGQGNRWRNGRTK